MSIVLEGQIKGNFDGFKDMQTILEFTDGSRWQQDEFKFIFYFSFMPKAKVIQEIGTYYLVVDGINERVKVKKVD